MAMHRVCTALILFGFSLAWADLNDSDCVKTTQITTAESSWSSRTVCTKDNLDLCTKPTNENADLPLEFSHGKKTEYVAVLFHGLSDSPYFLKDIGHLLFKSGMNVMIPRLTGHGTCAEHLNNKYAQLADWIGGGKHMGDVPWALEHAKQIGEKVYIGGFSLGGLLATYAVLNKLDTFAGLLLFSPAFKLNKNFMGKVKLGAFFSTPLHRIYGGNKNYGHGVRYQKISVEGTYETLLLGKKIQEFRKQNRSTGGIPVFMAVTEYDAAIDINSAIDVVQNFLKNATILVYGNAEQARQRNGVTSIISDEIRHSSIMLENAQWSEPEQNPLFGEFTKVFEPYITSTFGAPKK